MALILAVNHLICIAVVDPDARDCTIAGAAGPATLVLLGNAFLLNSMRHDDLNVEDTGLLCLDLFLNLLEALQKPRVAIIDILGVAVFQNVSGLWAILESQTLKLFIDICHTGGLRSHFRHWIT